MEVHLLYKFIKENNDPQNVSYDTMATVQQTLDVKINNIDGKLKKSKK